MDIQKQLSKAVRHFWQIRTHQHQNQGIASGRKDAGNRSEVTGGKHLDGFIKLFVEILIEAGLPDSSIHIRATTLPGYFRPTKNWDLAVIIDGHLLAAIPPRAVLPAGALNRAYHPA